MTKAELKEIPRLEERIRIKREQLELLRATLDSSSAAPQGERVQTSSANTSMRRADEIMDLENMLTEDCLFLLNLKGEAYSLIRSLTGAERELMELRYISGYSWEKIAVSMNYSYRHVHRLHGKILAELF